MKRVICLDVGEKRIGVAVSDDMGWTAQGVETIHTRGAEHDRERVCELMRQYDTDVIVSGLPKNLDGSEGFQAQRVRDFVAPLTMTTCFFTYHSSIKHARLNSTSRIS